MNRRQFLATGAASALGLQAAGPPSGGSEVKPDAVPLGKVRELFPRLRHQVFLNAAGGTPLGDFAAQGLRRYEELWREGQGEGWESGGGVQNLVTETRSRFARLVGARASEIGLVHCTKAGEQIVLDGLAGLDDGGNVVTNDLHFAGSLHNLVGLGRSGLDVRIVRSRGWDVSLDAMAEAMDDKTALVTVTLVSNVNGRVEPMAQLAEIAHSRGAYVYADIIQAAGIMPLDLRSLGVDFAACSGYKWLFGPHGAGFLFVRQEHQGTVLRDRLLPGHAKHNYRPWVEDPAQDHGDFVYHPPADAQRYQPGHVSYLGYCALNESLKFIEAFGPEAVLAHSLRLTRRLKEQVDPERYPCLSPHWRRSPILTFQVADPIRLSRRLRSANVVVTLAGNRLRVSPAVYNNDDDMDRLLEVLGQV